MTIAELYDQVDRLVSSDKLLDAEAVLHSYRQSSTTDIVPEELSESLYMLGHLYTQMGRLGESLNAYREAGLIGGNIVRSQSNQALLHYYYSHQYADAIACANAAYLAALASRDILNVHDMLSLQAASSHKQGNYNQRNVLLSQLTDHLRFSNVRLPYGMYVIEAISCGNTNSNSVLLYLNSLLQYVDEPQAREVMDAIALVQNDKTY